MRYLIWIARLSLFLLLFGFALKNTGHVVLHYYLGYEWNAPLALILLAFFALGMAIGLMASFATIFRQRREIAQIRKEKSGK